MPAKSTSKIPRPAVTQDELELLATTDAELQKRAFIQSFDQAQFLRRINQGERWQQLLQAHLYFDHVISQLLKDALVDPEAVNLSRMGFAQKLSFVKALGLLDDGLISAMGAINDLRNKIAHDLTFELTESNVTDLRNATPKFLRDAVLETSGRTLAGPIAFSELLVVVLMKVEVDRQGAILNRLRSRKSEIRLRTVLKKTPGAVYNP